MDNDQHLSKTLEQLLLGRIRDLSTPREPIPTGVSERLVGLPDIRAVVFDVYGTLFVSGSGDISLASQTRKPQVLTEALQSAGFLGKIAEAGAKGTAWLLQTIQQTHATQRQTGLAYPEVEICAIWENVLTALRQERLLEGAITPEMVLRVSVEYELRVNPVWPMPGLQATLQALQANQIVLGIVSNAQCYTLLLFPAFLGKPHDHLGFDPDLCAWSFQLREAKPSERLFRGVVDRLWQQYGITPAQTLYVGNDKLNDLFPASQGSLKTALFAGDQRSLRLRANDVRCANLEPDLIITTLSQLPEVISNVRNG